MRRRQPQHAEGWLVSYSDLITNLLLFFVVLVTASNMSTTKMQQIAKNVSGAEMPQSLESIRQEIEKKIEEKKLEGMLRTDIKDEGLELSMNSGIVFLSGDARIQPEMEDKVVSMLELLAPYSSRYHFAVEGHTDSQPLSKGARYESNWDLSAARAIEVRKRLSAAGVDDKRIRVEGYADTMALPEEQLTGLNEDERRARHRRVVVRVY